MPQQVINIGGGANDGTGDPLRTAFNKINTNFSEIYATSAAGSNLDVSDNDIEATNVNGDVNLIPNGTGLVNVIGDITASNLLEGCLVVAGPGGVLTTTAGFTFDGSRLQVGSITLEGNVIGTPVVGEGGSEDLVLSPSSSLVSIPDDLTVGGVAELAGLRVFNNTIVAINSNSNVVLDPTGSGMVTIASGNLRIVEANVPAASIGAVGDLAGEVAWGSGFIYICTANYDGVTQIWKRAPIAVW